MSWSNGANGFYSIVPKLYGELSRRGDGFEELEPLVPAGLTVELLNVVSKNTQDIE